MFNPSFIRDRTNPKALSIATGLSISTCYRLCRDTTYNPPGSVLFLVSKAIGQPMESLLEANTPTT